MVEGRIRSTVVVTTAAALIAAVIVDKLFLVKIATVFTEEAMITTVGVSFTTESPLITVIMALITSIEGLDTSFGAQVTFLGDLDTSLGRGACLVVIVVYLSIKSYKKKYSLGTKFKAASSQNFL